MEEEMKQLGRFFEIKKEKFVKIDEKDRKILYHLVDNSRTSLTEIASKVLLAKNSVLYRINRLVEKGIILKFFPFIDISRFGYYEYHVFLGLENLNPQKQRELILELRKTPCIKSIIEYSDKWDLEIVFAARGIRHFNYLLLEFLNKHYDVIAERDELAVIHTYYKKFLPKKIEKKKDMTNIPVTEKTATKLDEKDFKILKILSENCRLSSYEISRKMKLSADAVNYRLKRMQKSGVIDGYSCIVNLSKLDYKWYAVVLKLKKFNQDIEGRFKEFFNSSDTVLSAKKTLGTWDMLLYLGSKDSRDFHATIKELKNKFSDILVRYDTWIGYREHVFNYFPEIVKAQEFIR